MRRFAPVIEDSRDLGRGDRPAICRPDNDVVGLAVVESQLAVCADAVFHADEFITELANRAGGQLTEIPDCKPGVFAANLDEAGKREVVADENPGAGDEASGEGLVVTVSQADDPAVSVPGNVTAGVDFQDAKISVSFVADGVSLGEDGKPGFGELGFHFFHQMTVGQRKPRVGRSGRRNVEQRLAFDDPAAAVEQHGVAGGGGDRRVLSREDLRGSEFFDELNHGFCVVVVFVDTPRGLIRRAESGLLDMPSGLAYG
jgi:hypothetical protein